MYKKDSQSFMPDIEAGDGVVAFNGYGVRSRGSGFP